MVHPYWSWVLEALTTYRTYRDGSGRIASLDEKVVEPMCQILRIPMPTLRMPDVNHTTAQAHLKTAMSSLQKHPRPLQIADYLLAHGRNVKPGEFEALLTRSKSAWSVGTRAGKPGLVRRVPEGVQKASDAVIARSGRAGVRLARAWEELYGIDSNPSEAYRLAILAVEDAAVPVVSPTNERATLGTVLSQLESQGNSRLPMEREHDKAASDQVLIGMARMLWHGQHDRHGGQPSAPGAVSVDEARVALGVAVALVDWFSAGLVRRS
ncbi:hypothetical protein EBM89_10995 [Cellulomonas triticagri]|uniref:TIGR02391 family protein n=2 Tax=Cellulomonas triticagri TaxID=2483352 RepID=A0A3M2JEA4_9CELL|nr:hypothetical protein EBM89_10995 [Cellulomonas triticagri]